MSLEIKKKTFKNHFSRFQLRSQLLDLHAEKLSEAVVARKTIPQRVQQFSGEAIS